MQLDVSPDSRWLLGQLEVLADRLGLPVSYVPMESDGGLCRVGQIDKIFVSSLAPVPRQVAVLATALRAQDLSDMFVVPALRELLDA